MRHHARHRARSFWGTVTTQSKEHHVAVSPWSFSTVFEALWGQALCKLRGSPKARHSPATLKGRSESSPPFSSTRQWWGGRKSPDLGSVWTRVLTAALLPINWGPEGCHFASQNFCFPPYKMGTRKEIISCNFCDDSMRYAYKMFDSRLAKCEVLNIRWP